MKAPTLIEADLERVEAMGIKCITGDFAAEGDVLRHATDRVAEAVLSLGLEYKRERAAALASAGPSR